MAQAITTIQVELKQPTKAQMKRWRRNIKRAIDKLAKNGMFQMSGKRRKKKAVRRVV